jgi:hypothetical protein
MNKCGMRIVECEIFLILGYDFLLWFENSEIRTPNSAIQK